MRKARLKKTKDTVIDIYTAGVDRSLVRENLRRSVDERFLQLMEMQRFAEELQNARKRARPKQR